MFGFRSVAHAVEAKAAMVIVRSTGSWRGMIVSIFRRRMNEIHETLASLQNATTETKKIYLGYRNMGINCIVPLQSC
jgi:hypothetical protein